jgi:hypothetical protein
VMGLASSVERSFLTDVPDTPLSIARTSFPISRKSPPISNLPRRDLAAVLHTQGG